jgi:hypothetical protein
VRGKKHTQPSRAPGLLFPPPGPSNLYWLSPFPPPPVGTGDLLSCHVVVWKLCVGLVSAKFSRPVDRLKCCDCIEMLFGFVSATFWCPVVRLKCCNYIEMSFRLCIRHITTPCSSNPAWIFGYYVQDVTCCEVAALRNC